MHVKTPKKSAKKRQWCRRVGEDPFGGMDLCSFLLRYGKLHLPGHLTIISEPAVAGDLLSCFFLPSDLEVGFVSLAVSMWRLKVSCEFDARGL